MLGLVSNSDGRAEAVADAVDVFNASGVDTVIHCGDVGGRHVLDAMAPIGGAFVWGDRDKDRMVLLRHAQKVGIVCWGLFGEMELDGKRIAVLHGDDKKILRRISTSSSTTSSCTATSSRSRTRPSAALA